MMAIRELEHGPSSSSDDRRKKGDSRLTLQQKSRIWLPQFQSHNSDQVLSTTERKIPAIDDSISRRNIETKNDPFFPCRSGLCILNTVKIIEQNTLQKEQVTTTWKTILSWPNHYHLPFFHQANSRLKRRSYWYRKPGRVVIKPTDSEWLGLGIPWRTAGEDRTRPTGTLKEKSKNV